MASLLFGRRNPVRNIGLTLAIGLVAILLGGGYVYLLKIEDAEAVTELSRLQKSDPVEYLENVRHHKGFDTYLGEVRKTYGYDHYRNEVPAFLLGRWALSTQPKRVGYQYIAEDCSNYLAIEDGKIKEIGSDRASYKARYRISGSTVEADVGSGDVVPIRLVSFGMDLHHIEVTLPGENKPRYGYLCK